MINSERIVPITKSDLLSVFSVFLNLKFSDSAKFLKADGNADGVVEVGSMTNLWMASEPVKKIVFSADTVGFPPFFFVASYDFDGIYIGDEKSAISWDAASTASEVEKNATSLYMATKVTGENEFKLKKLGF